MIGPRRPAEILLNWFRPKGRCRRCVSGNIMRLGVADIHSRVRQKYPSLYAILHAAFDSAH